MKGNSLSEREKDHIIQKHEFELISKSTGKRYQLQYSSDKGKTKNK
jgi:hypothetical protein